MLVGDEADELELKKRARRRLVGAVVLVLLVVTLVPLLLDNEPRQISDDVEINITSTSRSQDSSDDRDAASIVESDSTVTLAAKSSLPSSAQSSINPDSTKVTDVKGAGYVVRLGLFSQERGIKDYVQKLESGGFSVVTERIETLKGPRTLVLVGVYSSKDQAERALELLNARKLTYGDAKITRTKP